MKKVLVHLSMLCLMAALVFSLGACKKDEMEVEDAPAASESMEPAMSEPAMSEPAMTDTMGTEPMATDMGTEMGTEPPAAQ